MEDDLNLLANGRGPKLFEDGPQFLFEWTTISFLKMGYGLIFVGKWKMTLIFFINGRQPHFFWKMEKDLHVFLDGR